MIIQSLRAMSDSASNAKKRPRGVQFATEVDESPPAPKRADLDSSSTSGMSFKGSSAAGDARNVHASGMSSNMTAALSKEELRRIKSQRQGTRALMSALAAEGGSDATSSQTLEAFQAAAGRIGDASSGGAVVLTGQQARDAQAGRGGDEDEEDSDEGGAGGVQEEGFARRRRGGIKGDAAQYADDASDDGDAGALGGESDDEGVEGGVLVKAEGEEEEEEVHGHRGRTRGSDTRMDSGEFKLSDKWGGGVKPERRGGDESPSATGVAPLDGDVPVVPFNLKAENDEGYFNAQGDYTRRAAVAEGDSWLASLDEDTKARGAEQEAEQQAAAAAAAKRAAASAEGGAGGAASMHPYTALAWLAQYMTDDDDTVSDAIRRVAKLAKGTAAGSDAQAWASVSQALSQATDALLQEGAFDIYSFDAEQVAEKLQQAAEMYAKESGGGQSAVGGGVWIGTA